MKNISLIILLISILSSCKDNTNLELKVLNNNIVVYNNKKDTINVIKYSVTNKSDVIYYFNNMIEADSLYQNGIYKEGKVLKIFDNDHKEAEYENIVVRPIQTHEQRMIALNYYQDKLAVESKRLGYNQVKRFYYSQGGYTNFFIHPNETLFFEYYINITDTISPNEDFRLKYPILDFKKRYYAKLIIASDTTKVEENLPRNIIQTIRKNNAKVYHGILESNAIPVKVID